MFGCYRHTLDGKGRVIIPSKFREEIGSLVYVTKNKKAGCLSIYPEQQWEKMMAQFRETPTTTLEELRFFFFNSVPCEVDKQGRFVLPEEYRRFAALNSEIVFAGLINSAEIWSAERYDAAEAESDALSVATGIYDQDKMGKLNI